MYQHKEVTHVRGDKCTNYLDLIIAHVKIYVEMLHYIHKYVPLLCVNQK